MPWFGKGMHSGALRSLGDTRGPEVTVLQVRNVQHRFLLSRCSLLIASNL